LYSPNKQKYKKLVTLIPTAFPFDMSYTLWRTFLQLPDSDFYDSFEIKLNFRTTTEGI